jgi:hypothetical protein
MVLELQWSSIHVFGNSDGAEEDSKASIGNLVEEPIRDQDVPSEIIMEE